MDIKILTRSPSSPTDSTTETRTDLDHTLEIRFMVDNYSKCLDIINFNKSVKF